MSFVSLELEDLLKALSRLEQDTKPNWGTMSAQQMVEHLNECIELSMNANHGIPLQIPSEKIVAFQQFLESDQPIIKNFKAVFAPENPPLRHEEIELAVDEFVDLWLSFEDFSSEKPNAIVLHPYYGELSVEQWKRMHQKHFSHHFNQFGLI